MNIGFDLDKIFVDYPPLVPDKLIDRLYKKKSNGILEYRFPSQLEQRLRQFSHQPLFRPTIKKNIEHLKKIDKEGNKLFLISSRFGFLKPQTERLIKKLEFDKVFDGIYFNYSNEQPHIFKSNLIQKLKLDIYIDDDFALLKYTAKHNKKTMFYWLNKHVKRNKLTRNIIAIPTLSDIFS